MLEEKYENLYQLLAGYFHQDFSYEYNDPEDAVQHFIEETDTETHKAVLRELRMLLAETPDDELDAAVYALACYYCPSRSRDISMRTWLEEVIEQIERPAKPGTRPRRDPATAANRYEGKLILRVLECYALLAINKLHALDKRLLETLTPELRQAYHASGTWQEIVEKVMKLPPTLPETIRELWAKETAIAQANNARVIPQKFAERVADQYTIV